MLKNRIISALVLAPPALVAVWLGGLPFTVLVGMAAVLMGWEWDKVSNGRFGFAGFVTGAAGLTASILAARQPETAFLVIVSATVAVGAHGLWRDGRSRALWQLGGALYIGLPCVGLVWLRHDDEIGRATIVWLFLIVWATDIGAYGFGRTIGGPLLAPSISPNKTWAGLIGGMACAGALGAVLASLFEPAWTAYIGVLSLVLAAIAQMGDLAESRFKRRFGVKDTSQIIPGHGGVLDRLDGLLAAGVVLAAFVWAQGGVGAP